MVWMVYKASGKLFVNVKKDHVNALQLIDETKNFLKIKKNLLSVVFIGEYSFPLKIWEPNNGGMEMNLGIILKRHFC